MDLAPLNAAIDAAYAAALANPQRVMPQTIAENVTLQTDTYVAPTGGGFRVVCRIKVPEVNFTVSKVRNHGPDTASERAWPTEGIEAAAQAHVARCIAQGADYVTRKGFDADRKVILLNKLLQVKEADALASKPKLVALYTWMETVQGMAVAGQTMFPQPPHTFEEVISE
jgi:hypothetical protein